MLIEGKNRRVINSYAYIGGGGGGGRRGEGGVQRSTKEE